MNTNPLTGPERRVPQALAELQPTTFETLAPRAGYRSTNWVWVVVDGLRKKGLVAGRRRRRQDEPYNHARSIRLADGVVVTGRGEIGRLEMYP